MTDTTKLAERIEALEGNVPSRAEFGCGRYDDTNAPRVKVGYDAASKTLAGHILLDDYTITFDHNCAEEVISAIRYCAAALRAQEAHNAD